MQYQNVCILWLQSEWPTHCEEMDWRWKVWKADVSKKILRERIRLSTKSIQRTKRKPWKNANQWIKANKRWYYKTFQTNTKHKRIRKVAQTIDFVLKKLI